MTRRQALEKFWWFVAGSPLLRAQESLEPAWRPPPERTPPLDELVNVLEVEEVARRRLDRALYEHTAAGAPGGLTVRRNREAFDRITFRPRVLVDVREMDLSVELLGQKLQAPILVAPMAHQRRLHAEGELATVQGAGEAKAAMVISQDSSYPLDQIASRAAAPLWLQVYPDPDHARLRDRVQQGLAAGCRAVCLTVGVPYQVVSEPDVHYGASKPLAGELRARSSTELNWDFLEQLRRLSKAPVLVKGILSAPEARAAVERGVHGIIVSNHGGRAVDGVPATIEVLPGIVEAAGGKVPVLIDSGFRRGTDILKALALGARAVLIGRPVLWGLAAYGSAGVKAVLEMLETELALAMGLSGKPNLAAVDRSLVQIHRR